MRTFTSVEHAIRWSVEHNSPATLTTDNFRAVISDAEALGYSVNYSELDKDMYDDREKYDVWGAEDPESEEMDWRMTVKVELQD